jgi:hypothetical protein
VMIFFEPVQGSKKGRRPGSATCAKRSGIGIIQPHMGILQNF